MKTKLSLLNSYAKLIIFVIASVFISQKSLAQCPTVGNPNVITCAFDGTNTTTVFDLITLASITGGNPNIEWYDSPTGGNLISSTNNLSDGIYYLDTDTAECSPRIAITVIVDGEGTPSDTVGFASGRCYGDTLADAENGFVPTGDDILWYSAPTGGAPINESTQVFNTTNFYISYTENGCESERSLMQFLIIPSTPPVFSIPDPICLLAGVNITVADLNAYVTNAGGNTILWYDTENDATTDFPGDGNSSNDPLLTSEIIIDGEDYWAVIESIPCPSIPGVIIPNLEIQPETGTPNPVGPFCETDGIAGTLPINADLTTMLTGTVDAGGVWSEDSGTNELSNASDTTISIQNIYNSLGDGSYSFTYTVTNGTPPNTCISSTTITIVIDPVLVAGTAAAPPIICENNLVNNFDLFTLLTGHDTGGTWNDDEGTGALSGNIVDLTAITQPYDPTGYDFTYTVNNGTACPPETETVTIIITEIPDLVINSPENFCITDNTTSTIDLFTYLTTDSSGGTGIWTDTNGTGALILPSTVDVTMLQGLGDGSYTFNYAVNNGDGCINDINMVVVIDPENEAGTPSSTTICETNLVNNFDLFTLLNGNDPGGSWADDNATGALTGNIVDLTAITLPYNPVGYNFTYTASNASCPDDMETVTIILVETPEAGTNGNLNICITAVTPTSTDLFTILTDEDAGGNWTDLSGSGALTLPSTVNIAILQALGAATYTYEYSIDNGDGCIDIAQVNIIIEPIPEPVNATLDVCLTDLVSGTIPFTTLDSFVTAPGTPGTVDWTIVPATPASTLTDPLTGSIDWTQIIANSTVGISTTFTYHASSNTSVDCSPDLGDVIITVIDIPAPLYTGTNTYCPNSGNITVQDIINDFTALLGGAINIYDVNPGGTPLDPTTVLVPNTYTFYAAEQDLVGAGCESNPRTMITITVNVNSNAGIDGNLSVCTTSSTLIDLFTLLNGTPDNGGAWTGPIATTNGDQGTIDPTLLTDGLHTFTYTVTGIVPCPDATAVIDITIDSLPNGGTDGLDQNLCSTDAVLDLFTVLTGSPDAGGVWSPVLNSGTGVFDPLTDTATTYTYTVTNACGTATPAAQVTVNVTLTPEINNPGDQQACDSFDLSVLPITGNNLTGSQNYYDAPNGGGTVLTTVTTVGVTTVYIYDETSPTICSDEESFTVTITTTPTINPITPVAVCDTFVFPGITGANLNNPTYNSEADGSGTSFTAGSQFIPTTAGMYTFYMNDSNGPTCTTQVPFTVEINLTPDAGADNTTAVTCISDADFDLTTLLGGTPDANGTWSPALTSGTNTYSPADDGANTYTYTVAGTAPCVDATAIVTITIQNPGLPTVVDQSFCLSSNPTVADLTATGTSLQWYSTETSTTPLANTETLIDGEDYWVSQDNGCESLRVVMIVTIDDPGTPDITLNGNQYCVVDNPSLANLETQIINDNNYAIVWYDAATGGNVLNLTTPLVHDEIYYASFTFVPCESSVRFPVTADLTDCDSTDLIIPNAFSPNGDGQNDTYTITNIDILFPNYTVEIYNRYGNIVYKGNINTSDFDGKSNQSSFISEDILPVGIYYYIIDFNDSQRNPEQGHLYLSR